MIREESIEQCNFPYEGLRYFHSLANWVEQNKNSKKEYISWKVGQRQLKLLKCHKPKQKEPFVIPKRMEDNTLYVPTSSSGKWIIKQLRNAFCHNGLTFHVATQEYEIKESNEVKIAGRFTLNSIMEFVDIFLQPKIVKNNKNSK